MMQSRSTADRAVDQVIALIKNGQCDKRISDIKRAIDIRNDKLKEAILEQVKEVYGEDYSIVPGRPSNPNPFIEKQMRRAESGQGPYPGEIQPGDSPHVQPVAAIGDEDPTDGIESRSPVFGSAPIPTE